MSTLEQELAEEKKWRGVFGEIADLNQQRAAVYENALITIRDECFSGNAYDIAVEALNNGAGCSSDQRGVSATQATGTAVRPTTTAGLLDRMGGSKGAPGNASAPNARSDALPVAAIAPAILLFYVAGRMVQHAQPEDTEEQNAVVKASLWREFVDAHAAMLHAIATKEQAR